MFTLRFIDQFPMMIFTSDRINVQWAIYGDCPNIMNTITALIKKNDHTPNKLVFPMIMIRQGLVGLELPVNSYGLDCIAIIDDAVPSLITCLRSYVEFRKKLVAWPERKPPPNIVIVHPSTI